MATRITWTKEKEEFLEDKWGIWSVQRLARHFGCTETAIISKVDKLKLGGAYSQYYTTIDIANLFGIHRRTVLVYWIKKYGLHAVSLPLRTQKIYRIKHEDLLEFLEHNQDKYSTLKLELYALGVEPDWLAEKRARDKITTPRKGEFWTLNEVKKLHELRDNGHTLKEIAVELDRTYNSVRRAHLRFKKGA